MFGLTSTYFGRLTLFPGFDEVSMGKMRKSRFISFLWGFDPLDINAQGSFFSQIARLVEMNEF